MGILGRKEAVASERAEAINKRGGQAIALVADVLSADQLQEAKGKMLSHFGTINGLVNAARGKHAGRCAATSGGHLPHEHGRHAKGDGSEPLGSLAAHAGFGEAMAKKSGSIVNISSMNSKRAITKVLGYNMGKAVDCYTQWFAVELANRYGDKIRMNALAPGFF